MSLEGSIKQYIDELIYEAIETISGKKHKIPNELPIEDRIRYLLENGKLKNKPINGVNSYFRLN